MKRSLKWGVFAMLAGLPLFATPAQANDDCTIVLCLLNPEGPRAEQTVCRPAIDKFFRDLARGRRGWPHCEGSGVDLQFVNSPFDPCPDGLVEAQAGAWVAQGKPRRRERSWFVQNAQDFEMTKAPRQSVGPELPFGAPLACVGKQVGVYSNYSGRRYDGEEETIFVYDRVEWQQPQSANAFDVIQNGQFVRRMHW